MIRIGLRLNDKMRIKSPQDFSKTFRRGIVVADATLVMHAIIASDRPVRLGISIPKKTGNAPVRNHWKRLIREGYRIQYGDFPPGLQIVVRPRKDAAADFTVIKRSLRSLAKRAVKKLAVQETTKRD